MYNRINSTPKMDELLQHKTNVINAAMWYLQSDWMTLDGLARAFKVSGNTINKWLCEAVANNYLTSVPMCKQLITKHILEYETKHHIKNSCLRQMYKTAVKGRNISIPA